MTSAYQNNGRIWLSAPHMGPDELGLVTEAFETNWLSSVGPHVDAFESEFTSLVGAHSCALGTGTAAIHLALRLLGCEQGDDVFCSSLTFIGSANPILYERATPVFVDSERTSWNMDPNVLADAISARVRVGKRPRAVMLVHLYGQAADVDAILEVASRHDVPVIEDAAEAVGTLYRGRHVGADGVIGTFSFNGNKIITTTSGGMLVSKNEAFVKRAKFWSTQARDPSIAYEHSEMGFNYRMSNVLAGIGRGQLRVLEARVAARRAIAERYAKAFASLDGIEPMPEAPFGRATKWLSCFLVDESRLGVSRDAIIAALAEQNIESRPVWKPMHSQKIFRDAPRYGGAVADDLFARGICLPSSSFLTEADQSRVIEAVRACATRGRERRSVR